jgi:uncharacterized membrane protein YeaQ/YmgE (transglycosylase-associated protein family)
MQISSVLSVGGISVGSGFAAAVASFVGARFPMSDWRQPSGTKAGIIVGSVASLVLAFVFNDLTAVSQFVAILCALVGAVGGNWLESQLS